jgi:hypothetical protein
LQTLSRCWMDVQFANADLRVDGAVLMSANTKF